MKITYKMGTDKYHIQVSHHLRVGKNALNEYDQSLTHSLLLRLTSCR